MEYQESKKNKTIFNKEEREAFINELDIPEEKAGRFTDFELMMTALARGYVDKKFFGSKKALNMDDVDLIRLNDSFQEEIEKTRNLLSIPKLDPEEDIKDYWISDDKGREAQIVESEWLNEKPDNSKEYLDNKIKKLMEECELPGNFYDWIQYNILYGEPPYKPYYNFDLFSQFIANTSEVIKAGLTTEEKKYLKWAISELLGISGKGRTPKKLSEVRKFLYKFIDIAKSPSRRKYRTKEKAIKELGEKKLRKPKSDARKKRVRRLEKRLERFKTKMKN